MAHWNVITQLLLHVLLTASVSADSSCNDVDTQACVVMAHQQPDFCSDQVLAQVACPKFCKLCPLKCYHCTTTLKDFHLCNTTKLCNQGQMCMRKQLVSTVDGHREYQLTCESKQTCDGLGLILPFGKRSHHVSRDISISCCDTDGCNYPAETASTTLVTSSTTSPRTTRATTTTAPRTITPAGCKKDVFIILDESNSLSRHHGFLDLQDFVSSVIQKLQIGPHNVLVSVATFAERATTRWYLNDHTSQSSLTHAVSSLHMNGGDGDLNAAISYAVSLARVGYNGNRLDAPDVVFIVTDDGARDHARELSYEHQLHAVTSNVIVVGLGHDVGSEAQHLSTDSHHYFHVPNPSYLHSTDLVNSVAHLIC